MWTEISPYRYRRKKKGKLVFSFVGYKTVTVNYTDGKAVSVKMELETASLEEVQVVAYGAQKKRTVVSAISSVKADELKELPTHSLENLCRGHMAGVEISNISGSPGGGGSLVAIRGYNSLFVEGEGDDRNYGTRFTSSTAYPCSRLLHRSPVRIRCPT